MNFIALEDIALKKLDIIRTAREKGQSIPMNWLEILDDFNSAMGDTFFSKNKTFFFAHLPSIKAIVSIYLNRGLIYLCWGVPDRGVFKNWLVSLMLKKSKYLFVNDEYTKNEIFKICGRQAILIPYFIDTKFYQFNSFVSRENFLFCNGSNDRNPELLLGLANLGYKIIWLCNNSELRVKYSGIHNNLIIETQISYERLRWLYQFCTAYIMPILKDDHCAGQTTSLEAISCGAPIIISSSRTASIIDNFKSVHVVYGNVLKDWVSAIISIKNDNDLTKITKKESLILQNKISSENMKNLLLSYLNK